MWPLAPKATQSSAAGAWAPSGDLCALPHHRKSSSAAEECKVSCKIVDGHSGSGERVCIRSDPQWVFSHWLKTGRPSKNSGMSHRTVAPLRTEVICAKQIFLSLKVNGSLYFAKV